MGLLLPGDDVFDIVERVQQGDPVVGWRGDPTMDVYLTAGKALVYAFDAKGERYLACSTPIVPGWQHDLLRRLRDGDWRRIDDIKQRVDTARHKLEKDQNDEWADGRGERIEKLRWMSQKAGIGYDQHTQQFYHL